MLASRRRLLYMLVVLALGSGALAVTKMAAWWVVVPPTIMLLGYMGMLREAARADAERRELARTRATATAAVAAAKRAAPPVPAAPVPRPDAEVIDISASLSVAGHKFYDQYADAKQRAVGDLVRQGCVRTFRTWGPRNEMLGWKVSCWPGVSRRAGKRRASSATAIWASSLPRLAPRQ